MGAGGQFSDPGWLGPAYYRGDSELPFYLQSFGNSLRIAGIASLAGLAIGTLRAAALRHSGERVKRVLLAFVTMTGNFSGVPLAFAFIIILGINGAVTLLLKSWGLIDGFNLYSGSGLILIYTYFQIPLAFAALPGLRCAAG